MTGFLALLAKFHQHKQGKQSHVPIRIKTAKDCINYGDLNKSQHVSYTEKCCVTAENTYVKCSMSFGISLYKYIYYIGHHMTTTSSKVQS